MYHQDTNDPSQLTNFYRGLTLNTAGYPGANLNDGEVARGDTMYHDYGPVAGVTNDGSLVVYPRIETHHGQSGSPVWYYDGRTTSSIGIMAVEVGYGFGTRITSQLYNGIHAAMNYDATHRPPQTASTSSGTVPTLKSKSYDAPVDATTNWTPPSNSANFVDPAPTATGTTVEALASTVQAGQPATFRAAVSGPFGVVPSGTVTFYDGWTVLGEVGLKTLSVFGVAGANLSTSGLSVGDHTITAVYNGTSEFQGSSASLTETVTPAVTTTTLNTSASTVQAGQPVTFTAVLGTPGNTPMGTMTFSDGTGVLGAASVQAVNGTAQATFTISALSVGTHTITATYDGDVGHSGSTSLVLSEIIMPPPPPVINPISSQTVSDGSILTLAVMAQSGDGSPLSFTLGTGAPAGASINAQTGLFTWTPSEFNGQAPGVYGVIITATNSGTQLSATATVNIKVGPSATDQGTGLPARTAVAFGLTQSTEYFSNIISAAYNQYLGRTPDANGLSYWVNLMRNQGLSDERLEASFIGSQEYITDHGGTGPNWIQGMYVNLLGRMPAASEVQLWVNNLNNGMNPSQIAYGFAASQERESQRVTADYQQYLGRGPGTSEVPYWVNVFLNGGSNEQVIAGFVSSQEYFSSHGNNVVDWLFADFRTTLQRLPDTNGYQYWLGKLQ